MRGRVRPGRQHDDLTGLTTTRPYSHDVPLADRRAAKHDTLIEPGEVADQGAGGELIPGQSYPDDHGDHQGHDGEAPKELHSDRPAGRRAATRRPTPTIQR